VYQHVLAAIDLSSNSNKILDAALSLAATASGEITVVHVVDTCVTGYGELTSKNHIASDIQKKQQLYPRLKALVEQSVTGDANIELLVGNPAEVLHEYASANNCDVVVVGSHGYGGVRLLLGPTANAVVHGALCDIYTVRIYD